MKIKVVIHEAEEGGYWAEVPSIPGCATQGDTLEELIHNLEEAIQGCLAVEVEPATLDEAAPTLAESGRSVRCRPRMNRWGGGRG